MGIHQGPYGDSRSYSRCSIGLHGPMGIETPNTRDTSTTIEKGHTI